MPNCGMQVVLKDSCYLARITRYRRWFNKSSSEMTGRVRRRSCAPPSLRDFVPCRSGISRMWFCAPPSLRDSVRWRSDISRRLRRGGANRKKKISVQVNLTLIFFFSVCGEKEIRTPDTLLEYTRFPGVPLKPLEHLSRTAL